MDISNMTQARWDRLNYAERERIRDNSDLSPQLVGLEGCRVEVVSTYDDTRRFNVGRSTGWRPIHLEISRKGASGGPAADRTYTSVRIIRRVQ